MRIVHVLPFTAFAATALTIVSASPARADTPEPAEAQPAEAPPSPTHPPPDVPPPVQAPPPGYASPGNAWPGQVPQQVIVVNPPRMPGQQVIVVNNSFANYYGYYGPWPRPERRSTAMMALGITTMGLGGACFLMGTALLSYAGPYDELTGVRNRNGSNGIAMMVGGLAGIVLGIPLVAIGAQRVPPARDRFVPRPAAGGLGWRF